MDNVVDMIDVFQVYLVVFDMHDGVVVGCKEIHEYMVY